MDSVTSKDTMINIDFFKRDRKLKTIVVYEADSTSGSWPPTGILEFQSWLDDEIAKIPEEHREKAKIEIDYKDIGYDTVFSTLEIKYSRLETTEEQYNREQNEAKQAELVRQKELAYLAELKAKYEN